MLFFTFLKSFDSSINRMAKTFDRNSAMRLWPACKPNLDTPNSAPVFHSQSSMLTLSNILPASQEIRNPFPLPTSSTCHIPCPIHVISLVSTAGRAPSRPLKTSPHFVLLIVSITQPTQVRGTPLHEDLMPGHVAWITDSATTGGLQGQTKLSWRLLPVTPSATTDY